MTESSVGKSPGAGWKRFASKAIVVLVAMGGIVAVRMIPVKETKTEVSEAPPINVSVLTLQAIPSLTDTFMLPAVVEPNRTVTLSAEVTGRIEFVAREGIPIETGHLLVQINRDLIQPQVRRAEAQVQRDQIGFERMKELVQAKATSQQDLDDAAVNLAVSQASLAEIQAQLKRTTIVSPCAGVLNESLVEVGEYVNPGTPVARIVDTETVRVIVGIPEGDVAYFSKGQSAEILADIRGKDQVLNGSIAYISASADARTRSTRTEVTVGNENGQLRSGQVVRVRLTRRQIPEALMIPLLAVIPMEEGHVVYVEEKGQAERRPVTFGILQKDRVEIRTGLQAGDRLIVAGHRFLAPGQKVRIVPESD
jgi:membrane fusion protein (multidrug efflux system)